MTHNRAARRAAARPRNALAAAGLEIADSRVKVIAGHVALWLHRPARPAGDARVAYSPEQAASVGAELIAGARSLGWSGDVDELLRSAATGAHPGVFSGVEQYYPPTNEQEVLR